MTSEDETAGLPPNIELAWGLRARPTKGPKRGLSVDGIVAAGVKIAATEGLGAVSMNRVAAEVGASAMSLYRYFAAKDELLALMVDAAIGLPPTITAQDGWRAGLSTWSWAYRRIMREHGWAIRVPIGGPPLTPNQITWLEHGLRALGDTDLDEAAKLSIILLLSGFVRNDALLEADIAAAQTGAKSMDNVMADFGAILAVVTDEVRFPAVTKVLRTGVMSKADDPDDEFTFGLERILDGIEVLIAKG